MSYVYCLGEISDERRKLLQVAQQSLSHGIAGVKHDEEIHTVGTAVENFISLYDNYWILYEFTGHGMW